MTALAEAAGKGTLKQLEKLVLDRNQIGDAGVTALAEAAGRASRNLNLENNQIGDAGVMALAEAAKKGTLPQLRDLRLPRQQHHLPASPGRPQGRPAQLCGSLSCLSYAARRVGLYPLSLRRLSV